MKKRVLWWVMKVKSDDITVIENSLTVLYRIWKGTITVSVVMTERKSNQVHYLSFNAMWLHAHTYNCNNNMLHVLKKALYNIQFNLNETHTSVAQIYMVTCIYRNLYLYPHNWGQLHESKISLRFLGIIFRFNRHDVSAFGFGFQENAIHEQTWVFFIDCFFVWNSETLGWGGGGGYDFLSNFPPF
jgi:hypothetical protein